MNKLPSNQDFNLNHRFIVEFDEKHEIQSWTIQSISLPKLNNRKKQPIQIIFIDPIGESMSYKISKLNNKLNSFFSFFKSEKLKILIVDGAGNITESWRIDFKKIDTIDFGYLSYANDSPRNIQITLTPTYIGLDK